jgi:hypothetical protein
MDTVDAEATDQRLKNQEHREIEEIKGDLSWRFNRTIEL